jgi:hypothetical protein
MNKIVKSKAPILKNGSMTSVPADFYPERKPFDFMPAFKKFLGKYKGDKEVELHSCPHHIYIEYAAWLNDTGKSLGCDKKYRENVDLWHEFLVTEKIISI